MSQLETREQGKMGEMWQRFYQDVAPQRPQGAVGDAPAVYYAQKPQEKCRYDTDLEQYDAQGVSIYIGIEQV